MTAARDFHDYLQDMLEATDKVASFVQGMTTERSLLIDAGLSTCSPPRPRPHANLCGSSTAPRDSSSGQMPCGLCCHLGLGHHARAERTRSGLPH